MFTQRPTYIAETMLHRSDYGIAPGYLSLEHIKPIEGSFFLNIGYTVKSGSSDAKEAKKINELVSLNFHQSTYNSSGELHTSSVSIHRDQKTYKVNIHDFKTICQNYTFTVTDRDYDTNRIADWVIYIRELITKVNSLEGASINTFLHAEELKIQFIKAISNMFASPKREDREAACVKFIKSIPILLESIVASDLNKQITLGALEHTDHLDSISNRKRI
ncbi:MAG: hypothetical protein ACYCQI_12865 [Gammaproteobacteria bacterium]